MLDVSCRKAFFMSLPFDFKTGAEIGVSHGDFANNILLVRPYTTLNLIDTWETNYQLPNPQEAYNIMLAKLKDYPPYRYNIIKSDSVAASYKFVDKSLDFIYIDADHSYESIKADIAAWYPKVKHGGLISGHDYCMSWPGVVKAVDEFCMDMGYQPQIISAKGDYNGDQDGGSPSWFFFKK